MLRTAVLVSGGGTNLQAILDASKAGELPEAQICAVISSSPCAYALQRAAAAGIPGICISPKSYANREEYNQAILDELLKQDVDLIVLAGFLVVIPPAIVDAFPNRIINIHPSLIPSFCGTGFYGLKVHEEALKRGVRVTGATVHFVDKGTDTGPIIAQKAVEVRQGDTPEILQRRVMEEAEWKLLPMVIRLISEGRVCVEDGHCVIRAKGEEE